MRIVHIAPNAPYNDNWGYQENLLPKYQKKAGHDVTLIVSNFTHKDGKIIETDCSDYVLADGVNVIRLKKKIYGHQVITNICSKLEVYPFLKKLRPDLIFYHGLNGTTIYDAVCYKKKINPGCVIVQDNHLDYNNGVRNLGIKQKLIRSIYRRIVRKTIPYIDKVYGVTPWRKQYAEDYYRVPDYKTDVLIMGADDEQLDIKNKERIRAEIREKYSVSDQDFLIVTGGKIDRAKKINLLMEACRDIEGVKLLIFGNVCEDIRENFEELLSQNDRIMYIGWIDASDVYRYFFGADLVVFPGGHSVMWEQACAAKIPCVFQKWDGMEHLNNGGNSVFLYPVTRESIQEKILSLRYTSDYFDMKKVAESSATDIFLYSHIAVKSVECANKT